MIGFISNWERGSLMKRLIAGKKLKHQCIYCNKEIIKGDVYYRHREVFEEDEMIFAWQYVVCPKCKYKEELHRKRFEKFTKKCIHPQKFIVTKYRYIPGESVKEPDSDICTLCGKIMI